MIETWLNKRKIAAINLFLIELYWNNKQGGGFGFYVNDEEWKFKERTDLAINVEDVIESLYRNKS